MKKLCIILADGFEEVEAITQVDYLRRAEIKVDMLTINDKKIVTGAHGIKIEADDLITGLDENKYDGIIIPGGSLGVENLLKDDRVINLVKKINNNKKLVAGICAGPLVLEKAGVLKNRQFTIYPGLEEDVKDGEYMDAGVVTSKNIITGKAVAYSPHLAFSIVRYLLDEYNYEKLINETKFFIEI